MKHLRTALVGGLFALASVIPATAETLKAEGGSAAGLSALVPQLLSKYTADGHEIRVNVDQTLTRSALKVATGAIDLASTPAGAFARMKVGKGPYKDLGQEAIDASGNIRSLFAFLGGHVHVITYADSGIESWEDLRGKRVFVGPPAGSFSAQTMKLIETVTGMKANEDYEAIRLAWGAANQAFEDGKFDLKARIRGARLAEVNGQSLVLRPNVPEAQEGCRQVHAPNFGVGERPLVGHGLDTRPTAHIQYRCGLEIRKPPPQGAQQVITHVGLTHPATFR